MTASERMAASNSWSSSMGGRAGRKEVREVTGEGLVIGKSESYSTFYYGSYREQLIKDSEFLRNDKRMGTELVDKLVLQLNRIYPQILNDKEAQKFRSLGVPTAIRLVELLSHLQGKGEEACHEFYRALHIHAEDVYFSLPTRIRRRETTDPKWTNTADDLREKFVLNDRGPWFFLCCFTVVVGVAFLYYHGEGKCLGDETGKVLGFTTLGLGTQAKEVLISYMDDRRRK